MNWHWPWNRQHDSSSVCDDRLDNAQRHVNELERRATKAATALDARLKRDHWSDTIAEIARRER